MAQRFSQTDLDLMDQVWSDLSPRNQANENDSFIHRSALRPNPIPPPMEQASMVEPGAPSRPLGADEVAELGNRDYPEPQPQPQRQSRYQPVWPGTIENFMPRRQFAANAAQAPTQMEPPTDVYGKPITSDNPFEPEYQNILKREREAEFRDRGFLRGVASDVAGGLIDYGELGLRGVRTLVPKGSALEEAATSGIERINRYKEETPFLQQDPNAGYLSRSIHGGIRSAFQSMAAGLPTAAAGAAMGSPLGPAGIAIGGVLGFAFGGATQFGLAQYDDVMERGKPLVEQGKLSPGDLQASAIRQGLYEGGFEFASDLLGGWMMGAGKLLTAPAKQALQATIRDMTKVGFKEFAKRAAGLTAAETSTEMVTQALQSEEDYRLGIGNQRFWDGAIDAFGPSVVASMIFAGLYHANVKLAQRSVLKSLENPEADPKKRAAAVDAIYAVLEQDHPVVASIWAQTAFDSIDNKQSISTDENVLNAQDRLNALKQVENPTPEEQKEIVKLEKVLSRLPEEPLPTNVADLELEQQYLESVRRTAPAGDELVDLEAVAERERQIQTALDAEEIYQQRFERTKVLDRRIGNLEKIPNPSEKQKQNLESFKQERTQLQDYEDQAAALGIRFIGMQEQAASKPSIPLFNDNNGATFTIMAGETLEDALKRKRGDFAVKEEETSVAIDKAANEAATSPKNDLPEPTEAQIEAGNYKKGHINLQGLDISIENPRGSTRKGVSPEGKPWETELTHHYGYLKGSVGRDKDHIDTFIGPDVENDRVFVVDQVDPKTGKYDEAKVMMGFQGEEEARQGYLSNYEKGWKGLGAMTEMSMDEFKTWLKEGNTKKPVAELGKEEPHDREGEGGLAGPLGEGETAGGAIQIEVPGGKATGAGALLEGQEGGEGKVTPVVEPKTPRTGPTFETATRRPLPMPGVVEKQEAEAPPSSGITIETSETPETAGPAGGKFQAGSSVKWTDRKGVEHTGIIQQWFKQSATIKDEGGKIYAVKRDKLTEVAPPAAGPIALEEPEKPVKESIETPAVTPPKMEEQGTEPVSMGQETVEQTWQPERNHQRDWDEKLKLGAKVKLVMRAGWVTQEGKLTRNGEKIAESKWEDLTSAAQRILGNEIDKYYEEGAVKEAEKAIREREALKEPTAPTFSENQLQVMREIRERSDYHYQKGQELSPGPGEVAAGSEHTSHFVKGEALATFNRELTKGRTPDEALEEAKKTAREIVAKWNDRRKKDIHSQLNEGHADSILEDKWREYLRASEVAPEPIPTEAEITIETPAEPVSEEEKPAGKKPKENELADSLIAAGFMREEDRGKKQYAYTLRKSMPNAKWLTMQEIKDRLYGAGATAKAGIGREVTGFHEAGLFDQRYLEDGTPIYAWKGTDPAQRASYTLEELDKKLGPISIWATYRGSGQSFSLYQMRGDEKPSTLPGENRQLLGTVQTSSDLEEVMSLGGLAGYAVGRLSRDQFKARIEEVNKKRLEAVTEEEKLKDYSSFSAKWNSMDYGKRQDIAQASTYKGMRAVVHRISASKWDQLSPGEQEEIHKTATSMGISKPAEPTQPKGAADQIQEMSMDQLDEILDAGEKAAISTEVETSSTEVETSQESGKPPSGEMTPTEEPEVVEESEVLEKTEKDEKRPFKIGDKVFPIRDKELLKAGTITRVEDAYSKDGKFISQLVQIDSEGPLKDPSDYMSESFQKEGEKFVPFKVGDKVFPIRDKKNLKGGTVSRVQDIHDADGAFIGQFIQLDSEGPLIDTSSYMLEGTLEAPEQEAPADITIEPAPVGGPRAPRGPRQPRAKRTAAEIAQSAASHGVKGIEEAVSGLYELFGGKSLRSFPGGIDEDTYQKAKPHFQKALEEFQAAGKDVKAFVKWAYDSFSSKIKPYLRRFIQEMKKIKPESPEVEMEEGGGEGITIETEEEEGAGKKKRTKKLLDTGEKLGGKRSSKDHRERSEAIEIELNGDTSDVPPKALAEFLIDKTTRSKYLKVDHAVEGRTPGTGRFLNTFRSLIATWPDWYKREMGARRKKNAVEVLERQLSGGWDGDAEKALKNQAEAKKSAAEYISTMEELNDAVSNAVTVGEARQNIMKLLVGEEQADKWLIEDRDQVKSDFSYSMNSSAIASDESILTDTGKGLGKFLTRKWDFAHFMITGWETIAESELDETKNKPIVRQRRNIFEITTPDTYRNGRDVTPEELLEAFALRGLDFGEWVEADFRQRSVNLTYDSFKMLAEALGANDKGISLSDAMRLGIGWGARGRGGRTAAEFYPGNKVIALTKTKGDGSLAHEWGHAFDYMTERDNFWADAEGRSVNAINDIKLALGTFYNTADLENMVMDLLRGFWSQARSRTGRLEEAKKFLQNEAIDHIQKQTKFKSDAIMLDGGERGKYYSKSEEMFARAFEAYVSDKLQGANTYLVDADFVAPGAVEILFNREHGAYPSEKERERFNRIFDDFFSQIEWSEDGIPKLKPDYVPVTTLERRRAKEAIDAMMERINQIYEALYGGEQSDDGLYWYAFEQTGRGVAAQPKGYMAYDDSYDLKKELVLAGASSEGVAGKGAVAYTDPLKADEVLMYFLKPIQYNEADTKITLEVPDGTNGLWGIRGPAALEEAPPENVRSPGEAGTPGAGGPGRPGEVGGGDTGPAAGGGPDRGGEGDDNAEIDLSPIGGGGTDIASGSDAFQPALRIDYTIRASSGLEQTNQTERFNNNIAAIRTLKQIEAEGRLATAEEQAILVKYSGWGELSEALSRYPTDTWKGRAEIVASVLSEDEIQAIKRSSLDAYYTAPTVAHNIYEGLQRMGFSGGKVLEPSCGVGHFFGTMPENIRRNSILTGVDIDGISARITGQLYQNANVLHQPFEETQIPDNFYDLTISNVPFGDSTPYDKKHNPDHWLIHDYFINKMIAITKPGGLIVAITSTGTMDKHSQDARKKYAEEADLLGAVRLPNGIFPGALAGADILYFRKKGEGLVPVPDLGDWVGTSSQTMPAVNTNGTAKGYDDMVTINNFFLGNADRVIGSMAVGYNQYGGARVQVTRRDDFAEKLTEAIDKLPTSIYSTAFVPSEINILDMIPEESDLKDFNYYVGDDGKIYQAQVGNPKLIDDLTADQTDKIKRLIGMRGIIRTLLRAQASDRPTNELNALRKKLRERYDAFFKKHGAINLRANHGLLKWDPDAGLLFSLENWDRDTKTVKSLADIFTRNTVAKVTPPTSAETSEESLVYSLMWRGRVDLPYMSTLTGKTQDTLVNELKGKIFDDPEKGYVTSDEYLSGNVRKKLATARAAAELDPKYRENVEALEIALPVDLPMEDIRARLGAAWVPADVVRRFVADLFGGYLDGFHLDHVVQTGLWTPHFRGRTKAQAKRYEEFAREHFVASNEYGVTDDRGRNRINLFKVGHERGLLDFALNGGFPKITDTVRYMDGTEREVLNIQLTDAANAKVDALQARFSAWISESEEVSKELKEIYNGRFNSFVERQYDGSHLTFPGKVPDELIKLRPHQKNAVWRFLQSGATYLAHEVGTGKTFTMIASIMEAKRMGLARKAVMATKKANMEQIAADFLKLYPGANILVMKIPENAEKRKRIFARIATGNYDCIIVNHDSFKKIPLSIETQREIISREVQNYERALEEAVMADASRHTVRDIQKRINKLREKLRKLADIERDDVPTVEEMGLDMIVVDESHTHKNIGFQTKYGDIKGVEADGSEIAFDLFMKTQYLHARNGRGILFASGTPLTNSVGELFNISRYLHPRELERFGIATFDAWANTFGVMKKEAEYAPEGGGFKLTSRFAEFVNIPELMALMRQHMDIRTAADLGIPRPDLIGGKPTAVDIGQNEFVQEFQEILKQRVRNYRADPKNVTYLGRPDNMLRIVNDGRLVAMDPRLYDPSAQDYAESKSNVCVDKVWELYQKPVAAIDRDFASKTFGKPYQEKNHLQLIFADRGVPGGRGFNLYADIKKKLVAKGILANQIAFAHDYPTDDKKVELYKKARAGEIRVLLGSTGLMGIGVNVQDRVSFLHHLDVDWTYANYEQRNGRGWRFGNRVQEIGIFNYGVKKTVDAFMWSTVAYKEKILQQVMSNDPKVRSVQDVSKTSAEASEMEALLSDDPMHKEKIELEAEVRRLSNIKSEYETSRRRAREKLARAPLEIQAAEKAVANNHLHLQIAEAITAFEVGNVPGLLPRDQGVFFDLEKDGGRANEAVNAILKKTKFANENQVAMLGRFGKIVFEEVTVREKDAKTGKEIEKKKTVKRFYPLSGALYGKDKGGLVFHIGKDIKHDYQLANGIKRGLTTIQNGLKANIKEKLTVARSLREEVPKLEKLVATSWDKEVELAEKDRRLRQVTEELLRRQDAEDARVRAEQGQRQGQQQAQGEIVVEPEEEDGGRQGFSLFQETEAGISGLDRRVVESHLAPLISKWTNAPAGGVRVVQSQEELPSRIVERARGKEIEGVYDPGTASVWLVADNLPSLERAEEVLAHEVYGHFGLEAFLGKKKADAFLAEVAMLYGKEGLKSIAEQHGFDLSTKEGRLKAAGEKLARMAENGERPGLLRRIYAAIRAALREAGFKIKLDDADIQRLLTRSREWVEGGRQAREGVAETQPLSFSASELREGKVDPEILFSLSSRDLLDKLQSKLEGTPKTAINVIFGKETDLGELEASFGIPAWLGKGNATVRGFQERQDRRDKDRSKIIHDYLRDTKALYNLSDKDQVEFDKLAFELDGDKVVDLPKFKKTGTRELIKGPQREIIKVPVYELNEKHYQALDDYLKKEKKVPENIRAAYMAARRALDKSLIQTYERLQEIQKLDPNLIEEYRNQMGQIENYWPHVREGNYHIRVVDPKADPKTEEPVKYREDFTAAGERHARFWYAKNIDRIAAEVKKDNAGIDLKSLEWTVERNKDMPEEVYDFPIAIDAMQMVADAAVDKMPEEAGIKAQLRKEFSQEISNVLKSRGHGAHFIKRRDIPGYQKTNAAKVLYNHFAGFSGWLTKMEAAHDYGDMLREIQAREHPGEYRWAVRYVHDMLQNQTRIDRAVDNAKALFFMKYLGFGIKTMAVNLTQNLVVGMPRLSMDIGIAGAGRQFAKAVRDIRLDITEKRIEEAKGRLSDEEKRLLGDMFAEGWGQSQLLHEIRGKVGGKTGKVLGKVARVMGYPMEMSEKYNRLSLGLSAFRAAREGTITTTKTLDALGLKKGEKASYDVAKAFAETVVKDSHFVFGKGNRPQFMRGTAGGKALSSVFTFRTFSYNQLSLWRWMLASGDKEGKKAFAYSLLAMIMLGGLSAIPLYNSLAALIREIFGEDLLGNGVRKQLPPGMRDLVMYGGPSLVGVTIGGSIGMELPVIDRLNVNKSISGQLGEGIGSLLGVPYSMFDELTKAVDAIKSGRPDRAAETVAPNFLKNIMSAGRLYQEGQTTVTGKPINVPGERFPRKLTEGEAIGKALGFQPVSSTKAFEIYKSLEQLKSYRDEKQSELANRYVAAMREGDRKEMVAVRNEAREWNRAAVVEGRREMRIDLNKAIEARKKARQPMKQMRGLAKEYRESYGM